MKHLLLPIVLVAAGPVSAQERMTPETCLGGWNAVMSMIMPDAPLPESTVSDDGWCELREFEAPVEQMTVAQFELIRWRAADIARVFEEGLPPRAFELEATGFNVVPRTGDPVFDYLLDLQSSAAKSDFGLNVRWDGVQNVVFVEDAYFAFSEGNRISATARIDDVDLTSLTTMQTSAGSAGLRDLSLVAEFDGWFEAFGAMVIGDIVLTRDDVPPEAQIATLQDNAIEVISQLPDDFMPQTSRSDLADFILTLPQPRGKAQIQISADPVIGAARMMPLAMMNDATTILDVVPLALDGVTMLFTWSPSAGE